MPELVAEHVDKSEVGDRVQNFIDLDDAIQVVCEPEDAERDKWTVTATTP